jgi:RNA polymerase sigma-70 factor (ECF subfamily)
MKDDVLVEQTLAGDHQAFNSLITDYYTDIYGMVLSWVKNPEDAKDLTQDVFISAYLDLPSLRDHKLFHSWLRQIARHKCQNWKRKQVNLVPLDNNLISKEPSTDEVLILRETLAKVMEAIDKLPESEKRLLKERYLDDVSYDELEVKHRVSTKALVVRLVRARRKIRDQLEKTLSAFVAFLHDHGKSILTGGAEIMKLSVKTKIIVGGIIAILILGGSGVLVNRYYMQNKSEQEVLQASQENYSKSPAKSVSNTERSSIKGVSNLDQKGVTREKVQTNESKAKTLAMNESKGDKSAKDADSSKVSGKPVDNKELTPEMKQKIEEYAKVADILPRLVEAYRKLSQAVEDAKAGKGSHGEVESAKAKELDYWRQLNAIFPELGLYKEWYDGPKSHPDPSEINVSQNLEPLIKYFGTELPWDGKTDYLQAKPWDESKISLKDAANPLR